MYRVYEGGSIESPVLAEGQGGLAENVTVGPAFAQNAFDTLIPGAGPIFIAISLAFFAFTTIIAYYYMAETNLRYLTRNLNNQVASNVLLRCLQLLILVATVLGCVSSSGSAWALGDIGVGLMAWLNILGILVIQKPALQVLRDYEQQKKQGLDPMFDPRPLGIKNADFWENYYDVKTGAIPVQNK